MKKEIIDVNPVTGVFNAIQFAKEQIIEQIHSASGNDKIEVKWRPLFGEKYTQNMKNLGKIIGYQAVINGEVTDYQLRADYDDVKGAHINYGCTARNSGFCRAVKVNISEVEALTRTPLQAVEYAWECMTKKHFNENSAYQDHDRVRRLMAHNSMQSRYCLFPLRVTDVEAAINAVVREASQRDVKNN